MFSNPRATLWLFAYNGLTVETHIAILQELRGWPNLTHRVKGDDANIDKARSKAASWYLEEPREEAGDVLLMIDHDSIWEIGNLGKIAKRALEHNAVVGGIYPKRVFGQGGAFRVTEGANEDYTIGEDKLIPAEFVGTGFIAIPRAILEAVAETLPTVKGDFKPFFMPYILEESGNEYPTDDQAFCARVRKAGYKVYASTWPRLKHAGNYIYRMVDAHTVPPEDRDITLDFRMPEPEKVAA